MELRDLALRLALALALGFVIGLERGWKDRDEEEGHRTAGIRTFSLIGLLGGIFGALSLNGDRVFLASGFLVTGAALAAYMWREGEHHKDFSATSLIAALLTFALGAYAVLGDITAAAGTGVAAAILLANKDILHGWLQRISWIELRSGLLLAAMTFIALPLLPNDPIDPWNAINPHELWLMTILIAAVSFAGYAAVKIVGPRRGLTLAAALGGLVSSTAVTLTLSRLAKENRAHTKLLAAGILASGCVMLARVLVITGLLNVPLAVKLAPVLLGAAAVLGAAALVFVNADAGRTARGTKDLVFKNPFDLTEVLRFALLLAVITIAVAMARRYLGEPGLLGIAALSGLADVDAMTLSMARLPEATSTAANAILVTIAVNGLAKCGYAAYAGGMRLGALLLLVTLASGGAAYAIMTAT